MVESYQTQRLARVFKETVRRVVRSAGLDLVPFESGFRTSVKRLLDEQRIDLVVDVGANEGQYGLLMRSLGYSGRIVSFEPGANAFRSLEATTRRDPNWSAINLALGSNDGTVELFVSANLVSSSTLSVNDRHIKSAPDSTVDHSEIVEMAKLDSVLSSDASQRILLKLDVQGAEFDVLLGASRTIGRTVALQSEASVQELYEGQKTHLDMLLWVADHGFDLVDVEPGFRDASSGALLQYDLLAAKSQIDGSRNA